MRFAGNFHPEWGYLVPSHSFVRSVRIALVSTAIGAASAAVVVISLSGRPGSSDGNGSIARALVIKEPVISPPAGTASFVDSAATETLIEGLARSKVLLAHIPSSAPDAPASAPSTDAITNEPTGTASPATVPVYDSAAGAVETVRIVKVRPARARLAKLAARNRRSPRKHHWQTATTRRNYRYHDQEFRPYVQFTESRPFSQFGFNETRHGDGW